MKFLTEKTYVPLSLLGALCVMIFFASEQRAAVNANTTAIIQLSEKLNREVQVLERKLQEKDIIFDARLKRIEEENEFVKSQIFNFTKDFSDRLARMEGKLDIMLFPKTRPGGK